MTVTQKLFEGRGHRDLSDQYEALPDYSPQADGTVVEKYQNGLDSNKKLEARARLISFFYGTNSKNILDTSRLEIKDAIGNKLHFSLFTDDNPKILSIVLQNPSGTLLMNLDLDLSVNSIDDCESLTFDNMTYLSQLLMIYKKNGQDGLKFLQEKGKDATGFDFCSHLGKLGFVENSRRSLAGIRNKLKSWWNGDNSNENQQ